MATLTGSACLLSGCASVQTQTDLESAAAALPSSPLLLSRPPRVHIAAFDIEGRISVRQGDKRNIVHFDWHHDATQDRLLLTTPLGQGLAELSRDDHGAHLQLSDRRTFEAADMEALAQRLFGMHLPLSRLPEWIVGQVVPPTEQNQDDTMGRPQWRQIDGWRITYMDYESASAHALPVLIDMQQFAEDIDVRLKIDRWHPIP